MEERYPIGATDHVSVTVHRDERATGYGQWAVAVRLPSAEATLRLPGHYADELAARLRAAETRVADGAPRHPVRLSRDEFLDVSVYRRDDGEDVLALTSSARSPLRVTLELPLEGIEPLALLLDRAHELVETLRRGVGLVPDTLPESLA
jgi:hypothetical protein